jgi:hypothetical protein
MKKITVVTGLALALIVPTVAGAKPTPNAGDKRAAKSECNMWRGQSHITHEAFLTKFNTFKACVKQKAAEEAQEAQNAHTNAAKECKALRDQDPAQFASDWGSNTDAHSEHGQGRNAFGKCVSTKAKAKEHKADEQDQEDATEFKNAAKTCADERMDDEAAFNTKWGENENYNNAFGKCVSRTVRGLEPAPPA